MNNQQIVDVIRLAMEAVLEAAATPGGAPSGVVYAAFTAHGMSLATYQTMINALVTAGKIKVEHDVITLAN